uniref:uncharacterized protein LOC120341495 isoform X2 n=1 Tax=Styela clava TaxID=7725 RepID=UPI001939E211|nr:uncharacterized protein LOC120341495 isoform X2 [Styela clava]
MAGVSNSDEGYILAHPSQLKDVKRKMEKMKKFRILMLTLKRLDSRYIKDLEYCLERCLLNDVSIRECFKDPGQLHKVLRAMKNNKLVNKDNQIQLDIRENNINFDCINTLRKLIKRESISALDLPEDLKMEFATAILEALHDVPNEISVLSMKWAVLSEASITYLHAMLLEKRITKYLSLAGCRGEHGLLLKHHLERLKREASKQRELNTEWYPVYNEVDDPYVAMTKLPPRLSSMYLALESGKVFKMGYQAKKTVTNKLKKMKNSVAKKSKKHQSSEEQIRMSDLKVDEHSDDHQNSTDDNLDQSSDEENLDYVNEHSEIVNGSSNLEEELKGLENLDLEKIDPSLKHVRGGNQSITVNIQQYVARGDIHDVRAQNVAYDNARMTATGSSTFMPRPIRNTEYPQIEYSEQDERLLPELPGLNESPEQRQQNIPTQSEPKIKTVTKCTKQDSVKINKSGTHISTQSEDDKSANGNETPVNTQQKKNVPSAPHKSNLSYDEGNLACTEQSNDADLQPTAIYIKHDNTGIHAYKHSQGKESSMDDKISTKTILEDNDVQDGYKHQEIVIQEPIKDKSLKHEATCPSTIFQKKTPNEEDVQGRTKQNNSTSQNNEVEQKSPEQRQQNIPTQSEPKIKTVTKCTKQDSVKINKSGTHISTQSKDDKSANGNETPVNTQQKKNVPSYPHKSNLSFDEGNLACTEQSNDADLQPTAIYIKHDNTGIHAYKHSQGKESSMDDKISTKTILEDNDVQDGYKHQEIVIQEPIKDKSLEHEATCPSTIFQKKTPNEEEVQGRTKQNNSTSQNNEVEQKITEQRQSCPPELQSTHAKANSRYRPTENTNLLTTTDSNDGASYFQDKKSGEEVDENITPKDNGTFINSHQRIQRMNVQENLSDDRSYLELTPLLPTKLPLNGDNAKTVLGHEKINTNIRKEEESDETVALVISKIVVKSASIKRNKTLSKVTNRDANYNILPFLGEDGEIINDTKMVPEKQNKNLDSVLNRTVSHKYEETTLPRNASQPPETIPDEKVATPKTNKPKENCYQITEASQVQRKAATLPRKSSNIQNDTIHDGSGKVASILEQEMKNVVHSEEASKLISTRQKSVKDSTSIFESSSYESNADAGHSAEVAEVIAKKRLSVKERAAMYQSSLKRKKN